MANQEQVHRLLQRVKNWNAWRRENSNNFIDLSGADLSGADLRSADLRSADLSGADLSGAYLNAANLSGANLIRANLIRAYPNSANLSDAYLNAANLSYASLRTANLSGAHLYGADLSSANLSGANLSGANLIRANLIGANLSSTHFKETKIGFTIFGDIDLRTIQELETVIHRYPSTIGTDTILRSKGDIPEVFLRGAGLSDTFITYARSLAQHPIEYYTCFISYSSKDEAFVKRLYTNLQNNNVRCWFAPEDMKIGDEIRPRIDETIHLFDKLLLILSEHSIASNWVAYEVKKALNKEPQGIPTVLFPIRIDDTILTCNTSWAQDIKQTRNIGDFTHWKDHDAYKQAFNRLLHDLKADNKT